MLTKLGDERILRSVAADGERDSRYEIFHDTLAEPVLAWKAAHETQSELDRERADSDQAAPPPDRGARRRRGRAAGHGRGDGLRPDPAKRGQVAGDARARPGSSRRRRSRSSPVDPQLSLALGVESADLKRTTQAEDVLRQALISSKERAILPSKGAVRSVSFSRDGSLLATASDDGTARIWRANGALAAHSAAPRAGGLGRLQPRRLAGADGKRGRDGADLARGRRRPDRDAPPPWPRDERVVQPGRKARPDHEPRRHGAPVEGEDGRARPGRRARPSGAERVAERRRTAPRHDQQRSGGTEPARSPLRAAKRAARPAVAGQGRDHRLLQPGRHAPGHRRRGPHRGGLARRRRAPAVPVRRSPGRRDRRRLQSQTGS